MTTIDLHLGDCLERMRELPANSVDSIVTDPPYELGFMGKSWDSTGIAYNTAMWMEALRVLKPGGHLLAFSGSRTYHRMACAIEDAGFEIRDQIMWVYGSGFPKSLDVSKAIDKQAGFERERVDYTGGIASGTNNYGGNGTVHVGTKVGNEAITDKAKQWAGWGTALKPAHEPIVLARKPLAEKTVAANVLEYGTGALNIDGSRVGYESASDKEKALKGDAFKRKDVSDKGWSRPWMSDQNKIDEINRAAKERADQGRWPANLIHDGSDEVVEGFPDTTKGTARVGRPGGSTFGGTAMGDEVIGTWYGDSGSAARFFYCAKASKRDRNEGLDGFKERIVEIGDERPSGNSWERRDKRQTIPRANHHPTVKPTELMRYLVRMITPPNGTVLDPFMGSGSTGKASVLEHFNFIGIDQSAEYLEIATARITHAQEQIESQLL